MGDPHNNCIWTQHLGGGKEGKGGGGKGGGGGVIRCSMGQFHNDDFMQQKTYVCVLYSADSTNLRVTCGHSQDAKTLTSSKHSLSVV